MKILAVDPGTECGWAHSSGGSGTWDLRVRTDESDGMRLIRLTGKLLEIEEAVGIELLVYEAARYATENSHRALVVQSEMQGQLKRTAIERGWQYKGYSASEIKRHATGKGNASKDHVLRAARSRWAKGENHNEADALWLLDLATETVGKVSYNGM